MGDCIEDTNNACVVRRLEGDEGMIRVRKADCVINATWLELKLSHSTGAGCWVLGFKA